MQVVFPYIGKESWPGVLALMPTSGVYQIKGRDYHNVLVPTTAVPIGGGLLFIPTDAVEVPVMSVDSPIQFYGSMGTSTSQYIEPLKQLDDAPPAPAR